MTTIKLSTNTPWPYLVNKIISKKKRTVKTVNKFTCIAIDMRENKLSNILNYLEICCRIYQHYIDNFKSLRRKNK